MCGGLAGACGLHAAPVLVRTTSEICRGYRPICHSLPPRLSYVQRPSESSLAILCWARLVNQDRLPVGTTFLRGHPTHSLMLHAFRGRTGGCFQQVCRQVRAVQSRAPTTACVTFFVKTRMLRKFRDSTRTILLPRRGFEPHLFVLSKTHTIIVVLVILRLGGNDGHLERRTSGLKMLFFLLSSTAPTKTQWLEPEPETPLERKHRTGGIHLPQIDLNK
ncbi:hypothetical protein DFH08DRAFT_930389 [Mycena albidolilacea]|uniref:Uncharacterized protein n=1 Tax=Mycena albidolilacea TaxID=1033008 RepID=A0AAD7F1P8_9AGAR|nr:hypothetical protein DFH08DRAFT_930389 [Mycena albidolilacea]